MSDKKIIAVVGATGAQGGGLVRAILADPNGPYVARAVTRKANSGAAKALAKQGAEVVEADLNDEASMARAFKNAYGVFLVTNFWQERTAAEEQAQTRAEMELAQAGIGARAAKAAGVQHVIWSTLEDTRKHFPLSDRRMPTLDGKYKVPHFDAKAEANASFTRVGVPTTFLQTTFYYEAFLRGFGPTRDKDGKLVLTLPMANAKLAAIAAEDIGRTALGIFRRGDRFIGKTVSIAGEHLTGSDFAKAFSKAFGEEVAYRPYTHDQFRSFPVPFATEIANTFQYYVEAADDFTGARDLKLVRELNPQLQSFGTWLAVHKDAIRPK
jgi:uncharacterized protein YbjT (DUF2867 family)